MKPASAVVSAALAAVVSAMSSAGNVVLGEEPEPTPAATLPGMDASHQHLELLLGYGIASKFRRSESDSLTRQFAVASPRLGLFVTNTIGEPPLRGSLEVLGQINVFSFFSPTTRYAAGGGPLLRYNFWTGTRLTPYVDVGGGFMAHDIGRPEQGGHFGFQIQTALGLHVFVAEGTALTFEYRFHHLSSGFMYNPNNGVNSSLFLLGLSFFI